jgi:hypothetical protein
MPSIKILELHPTGLDLFQDSESFLNELTDQEIGGIIGGKKGDEVASQESVSVEITIVTRTIVTQGAIVLGDL